jgi:hypothetical protein
VVLELDRDLELIMTAPVLLPSDVLGEIARQIAVIGRAGGLRLDAEDSPELGETMPIWVLDQDSSKSPLALGSARANGRWYHQVYRRGRPELFAFSQPLGPRASDWQVTAVFESPIPQSIDAAIRVADAAFPQDGEARLLMIPGYGVQCLWLVTVGRNVLIPAVVPPAFREQVRPLQPYDPDELFGHLAQLQYVRGIVE